MQSARSFVVLALLGGVEACSLLTNTGGLTTESQTDGGGAEVAADAGVQRDAEADTSSSDAPTTDGAPVDASESGVDAALESGTDGAGEAGVDAGDAGLDADAGPASPSKVLYLVQPASRAAFTSVAGADALCDANRSGGIASAKAVIVGTTRRACTTAGCAGGPAEHLDWPLAPNMFYTRLDRVTVIGRTTENGTFNSIGNSVGTSNSQHVWTGLNANSSRTWTDWTNSVYTCSDWTVTTGPSYGYAAYAGPNYPQASFGQFIDDCGLNYVLYCAEVL